MEKVESKSHNDRKNDNFYPISMACRAAKVGLHPTIDIEGEFVYAVTAAEGIILSLFMSNEQ